jgi:UDP-2,3-diacylglucosamine pyrophosphatase LpxH
MKIITDTCEKIAQQVGCCQPVSDKYLELINNPPEDRGNRLCVSVSDIHLTDGTVGFQNLGENAWKAFYNTLLQRCRSYSINEVLFVLDGDIVDMIRSGQWAANKIYPWERERKAEFSKVVNKITKEIVEVQHKAFFEMLSGLKERLKKEAGVEKVKIIITLGNHDKELFCDQKALTYFYEKGLNIKIKDISLEERQAIGRMYGDEHQFDNLNTAPYLPFYYGDRGFRFFTTHGQWRDKENTRLVKAEQGLPGWSAEEGWNVEKWQKLAYSPFFLPCFGDSVAAGVLSTFIYEVKRKLDEAHYYDKKLTRILDELDLYRPTYAALTRILKETNDMRSEKRGEKAVQIIEDTLYDCIIEWLGWDFTYQTSPLMRRIGLKLIKKTLIFLKSLGWGFEITSMAWIMKFLAFIDRHHRKGVTLREMRRFPSFMPAYRHYGFQIHGEGHTHAPLQEEPNISSKRPSTYINFGTWRDQIIPRKRKGYRRQGTLRTFYILDLINKTDSAKESPRVFDYFVQDTVHWSDAKDSMAQDARKLQPKI